MTPGDAVFTVEGGRPLVGRLRVPGDKSLSHRALLLGALARGESRVRGLSDGDDVAHTGAALRALGARLGDISPGETVLFGGPDSLRAAREPLDMGNSGTTMRLLAGVVAGCSFTSRLTGDASLSTRPMDRVAVPLRLMGAAVEGRGASCLPPLTIRGGPLRGIDYTTPMASAQVKSCVLLAALGAEGDTVVREPVLTRRHTEEILARCGALLSEQDEDGVHVVRLTPTELHGFELDVPGDPSQAAFWVVAACVVPGSEVTLERVYVGRGRRGYLDALTRMGADIDEVPSTGPADLAATADVVARFGPLQGTDVMASEITGLDEVPVLAVAAACASGDTVFRSVGELRLKESDRLAGVVDLVRVFGARAEVDGDDLLVQGAGRLTAGAVDARGDHRMAMAAAVAGLAAGPEPTRIAGWAAVATSYPRFAADLGRLSRAGRGSP
ncbi:MAG TPA: 3-phosphoshikimate 1-carboxyvinyltransferase [Acidimicrobiales bacterium]|nr:3-phosphoshikimate 1-carboxyvinyltransferase [Acidimicrobiales bacterium]